MKKCERKLRKGRLSRQSRFHLDGRTRTRVVKWQLFANALHGPVCSTWPTDPHPRPDVQFNHSAGIPWPASRAWNRTRYRSRIVTWRL